MKWKIIDMNHVKIDHSSQLGQNQTAISILKLENIFTTQIHYILS